MVTRDIKLLVILCFSSLMAIGQDNIIQIYNPSFESYYSRSNVELDIWLSCEKNGQLAPDIHGKSKNLWSNNKEPYSGNSYIGLAIQPDSIFEYISQRLNTPLLKDQHYAMELQLCKPTSYYRPASKQDYLKSDRIDFTNTIQLQLWGFHDNCDPGELLYKIDSIDNTDWKKYSLTFVPSETYSYIALIPYFIEGQNLHGSILIDECSPIFETDENFEYNYYQPNVDSLFLLYEDAFDSSKDLYKVNNKFVSYYPEKNESNFWLYDFSNPNFYSKRFIQKASYLTRITELRFSYDNVLTDKVVFYEDATHTSYYSDEVVASTKRYQNGVLTGRQKIFWPSGNPMIEFDMTMDKIYIGKDEQRKNVFKYTHRIRHLYIASRDGMELSYFKLPKQIDLGDIIITPDMELIFYDTSGKQIDKMLIENNYINSNTLVSILPK